jgi:hypothetical protein
LPRRSNLDTFVSRAGNFFFPQESFFGPDRGKIVFFFLVPIGEKLCFFGPDQGRRNGKKGKSKKSDNGKTAN